MDDGVIKFRINWQQAPAPTDPALAGLMHWRNVMYDMGLIGFDEQYRVGYGNISLRTGERTFIISGTQTGHIPKLPSEHYTTVTDYDIAQNELICSGPVKASSESLTHAAVYEANPEIQAIIHIHHDAQWEAWLDEIPTTHKDVPYGTPEMAGEIHHLFKDYKMSTTGLIAMAGHQGGIIAFGATLEEAAAPYLEVFGN